MALTCAVFTESFATKYRASGAGLTFQLAGFVTGVAGCCHSSCAPPDVRYCWRMATHSLDLYRNDCHVHCSVLLCEGNQRSYSGINECRLFFP